MKAVPKRPDASRRTYEQVQRHLIELSVNLANLWFKHQCADPCAHYRLYLRPCSGDRPGELAIGTEVPSAQFAQAMPARLSPANTVEQVQRQIANALRPLPIFATVGDRLPTICSLVS